MLRFMSFFLHKFFKKVYSQIMVDENQINLLKELEQSGGTLCIVSNHISYVDFMVQSYIFYAYGLKCPFVNASHDFLNINLISKLLRGTGAFFTPS